VGETRLVTGNECSMLYLPLSHHNALEPKDHERIAMADSEQTLITFLDLACASQRRRRLSESDKLMVLAAVAATHLGWPDVAEACREKVLAHNPRHLVRRWPTIAAALSTERFGAYLKHMQRQYSPERAEYMLGCLGERPVFTGSSAHETATALLAKHSRQQAVDRANASKSSGSPTLYADGQSPGSTGRAVDVKSGVKRLAIGLPGRAVARRLRSKKLNQEYLWWPYWAGLALLAVAALVWAARRHG
jgi:hypothetical protein